VFVAVRAVWNALSTKIQLYQRLKTAEMKLQNLFGANSQRLIASESQPQRTPGRLAALRRIAFRETAFRF